MSDRGITRRDVLFGAGLVGSAAWGLFSPLSDSGSSSLGFCPSEEDLEEMSWVRGAFQKPRRSVHTPGLIHSTLEIENDGGRSATYEEQIRLANRDREYIDYNAALVDVTVPAEGSVTAEVSVWIPKDFDGGALSAPWLGSSCDLIAPAVQYLEVTGSV